MPRYQHFNFLLNLFYSFVKLSLLVLALMSSARLYLYYTYSSASSYSILELVSAFWLGIRLDVSILAYIYSIPVLLLFLTWLLNLKFLQKFLYGFFRLYFLFFLTFLSALTFGDLVYFSFFSEHSTLMIFGVVDDDTGALIDTAFANYNIPLVISLLTTFFIFLYFVILKILKKRTRFSVEWNIAAQALFFLSIIIVVALLGRGSVGLFPLAKDIPDISADQIINKLPQTAGYAMLNSYEQYSKSKSGNYDLIKTAGFSGRIDKAFEIHMQTTEIHRDNLLNNFKYKTSKKEVLKEKFPHVVVVMVESFGMPLLDYQSKNFNIMGRLKRHFEEDIIFTNFISSSNGTVVSLEPLLLNITARPNSTSFAQSSFLNTSFQQAGAKVYKDAGYETSFVYGGDLSWRNIGSFVSRQGFNKIEGKATISASLGLNAEDISHVWGIFDGYVYNYVYEKLKSATTPQFIFILTTNNHPPYTIPSDYKSNTLELSQDLKEHITGDIELAKSRFKDYAYAVDMAGEFMDKIKSSSLANNTVITITADNNTVEGIMKYDEYFTQTKRIPFYLYLPEYLKPKEGIDTTLPSSHKDIFPTLYDREYISIGTNLLDENHIHCGFNDVGIIMSKDGGFKDTKAKTSEQKKCQEYYRASLAVTEYLIQSHKK